eukprot:3730820-Pleurochrysis_carterae.AAC.1
MGLRIGACMRSRARSVIMSPDRFSPTWNSATEKWLKGLQPHAGECVRLLSLFSSVCVVLLARSATRLPFEKPICKMLNRTERVQLLRVLSHRAP